MSADDQTPVGRFVEEHLAEPSAAVVAWALMRLGLDRGPAYVDVCEEGDGIHELDLDSALDALWARWRDRGAPDELAHFVQALADLATGGQATNEDDGPSDFIYAMF